MNVYAAALHNHAYQSERLDKMIQLEQKNIPSSRPTAGKSQLLSD
jgi:hypothetical protein